tara:strand:- start:787 stop:897 length:111 start_codon:yes stop_codon:yes gene_type:complete
MKYYNLKPTPSPQIIQNYESNDKNTMKGRDINAKEI